MNIWVPRTKILEPEILLPGSRVSGRFRITGRLPDGRERVLQDWFPNLITDLGLERWGTGAPISYCSVGTSTIPPTTLDTALKTFSRQHNTTPGASASAQTSEPWFGWIRQDFVFNPPGVEIAVGEIGVGWGTAGTNLWSRSLPQDSNGASLILNWLANETLTISYEARKYPWLTDVPHTTVISGVTYTGIIRPAYISDNYWGRFWNGAITAAYNPTISGVMAYSGALGTINTGPAGTSATLTSTNNAYSASALEATGSGVAGPTIANFAGGVAAIRVPSLACGYQVSFSPAIAKLNTHTLTFNVTSGKWGRKD